MLSDEQKQIVDEKIERYYDKYVISILVKLGPMGGKEAATEIFHHIYMLYVDNEHLDRHKTDRGQIVLFDEYLKQMCDDILAERYKQWKREQEEG
jgi:hypothetical protein